MTFNCEFWKLARNICCKVFNTFYPFSQLFNILFSRRTTRQFCFLLLDLHCFKHDLGTPGTLLGGPEGLRQFCCYPVTYKMRCTNVNVLAV